MPIGTFTDVARLANGTPNWVENLTGNNGQIKYSVAVFNSGQLVRLKSDQDVYIQFMREWVYAPQFGDGFFEQPARVWNSTLGDVAADATLRTPTVAVSATFPPILNLTAPIAGALDVKWRQDVLADQLKFYLGSRPSSTAGLLAQQRGQLKKVNYNYSTRYKNGDAAKPLQWTVTYQDNGATIWYWDAVAVGWTSTVTWNNITGSITDATYVSAVLPDNDTVTHQLLIRSGGNYTGVVSNIDDVGFYETKAMGAGAVLEADVEYMFSPPFRCRLAAEFTITPTTLRIDNMVQ